MKFIYPNCFAVITAAMLLDGNPAAYGDPPSESKLSVTDLLEVIDDDDWILVDTRTTDAYNGWALDGIQRGGHIPDAVDFPASWLDSDDKDKNEKLAAALHTKRIERDKHIVLYSATS